MVFYQSGQFSWVGDQESPLQIINLKEGGLCARREFSAF